MIGTEAIDVDVLGWGRLVDSMSSDGVGSGSRGRDREDTSDKSKSNSSAGWKLVSVSFQEWEELRGGFEQLDYLRDILKDHINGDSSSNTL